MLIILPSNVWTQMPRPFSVIDSETPGTLLESKSVILGEPSESV